MSLYQRKDPAGNLISPYWYCEFEDGGKKIRKSTEVIISTRTQKALQKSQAKARQQEALIKEQYFREKQEAAERPRKREITLEDWAEKFLEIAALDYKHKPKTLSYYTERVKALLKFKELRIALLSKIDAELIDDFRLWRSRTTKTYGIRRPKGQATTTADSLRSVSLTTINHDLRALRRMMNKAREKNYKVSDVRVRLNLKAEKVRDRYITKAEELAYLDAAHQPLKDFAIITLNTGMRPDSELCQMRWENINFSRETIFIPDGKSAAAQRTIPLTKSAREVLERRHKDAGRPKTGYVFAGEGNQPIKYSVIDTQHDRVMEKLKWEVRARIYDMRHTALTRMYYTGMGIKDLMKIAGHSDIKMTQRYIKGNDSHVQEAFKRFGEYAEAESQPKKRAKAKTA